VSATPAKPPGKKPWFGRVPAWCGLFASTAVIAFTVHKARADGYSLKVAASPAPPLAALAPLAPAADPVAAPAPLMPPAAVPEAPASALPASAPGGLDEPEPPAPVVTAEPASPADTPLDENDAAEYLARAWYAVLQRPARETTVAVLWAHWAHETARGQRMHAYNFGGIKGRGPSGAGVVVWTREGAAATDLVQRTFRAYDSASEGAYDYVALLRKRYPTAFRAARYGRVDDFVAALERGGYFTADPSAYLRALRILSGECRRRGISTSAVARVRESREALPVLAAASE